MEINIFGEDVTETAAVKPHRMVKVLGEGYGVLTMMSGDKVHTRTCPACRKETRIIELDDGYCDTVSCEHYVGAKVRTVKVIDTPAEGDDHGTWHMEDRLEGFEFLVDTEEDEQELLKAEVDYIEYVDITCPYCKYVDRMEEFEMPSSSMVCDNCRKTFLLK